jgi:kynurenine formamidase
MLASVQLKDKTVQIDLSKPIDLSIPMRAGEENVNAFYIPPVKYEPFQAGTFIGDVSRGGSCNVFSISFNPHGNGTHTETVGHISIEKYPIYNCLKRFFFEAQVITVNPESMDGDKVITKNQLEKILKGRSAETLIIRTLPNDDNKKIAHYSGTNPAYMAKNAADYLRELSVNHLILDLPSIDREEDGGKLQAHHAFWNYPSNPRIHSTITELSYIPENVKDGYYLMNLLIASFDNDASPSKPLLFEY